MEVNERIKKKRKQLGLTMKQVADKLGVSESLISRYESKEVKNMGIDKLIPLAEVLNTTPAYLMGWEKETAPVIPIEEYTNREKEHLKSYRRLFTADKDVVDKITNALLQTSYDMKSSP